MEKSAVLGSERKRCRSPAHPAFDLKIALERVQLFYDREHIAWVSLTATLKHWGYGPKSSSGLRTLAALRHFALLEEAGRGGERHFRLSALAKLILLHRGSDTQHRAAIRTAALKPPVYAKLWVAWGVGPSLPSQVSMRYQLETEWGFNPNAIGPFVANFRTTLEFAGLISSAVIPANGDGDSRGHADTVHSADFVPPRAKAKIPVTPASSNGNGTPGKEVMDFTIPLHGAGVAVLSIPVPLSDRNFTQVTEWLTWAHNALVSREHDPDDGDS